MFTHRRLLCALLCAAALAASISAAETHAGDVLCFSPADFGEEITGVCITDVPEEEFADLYREGWHYEIEEGEK